MKYSLKCLTPLLVGDGSRLSPIDYMLWKEQVNVLDQTRILRMLSKSPRLDTYLAQVRKADRLSFSEWGGYAQNYAVRRIPLEHSSIAKAWESAPLEALHIPTFSTGPSGAFIPGSALKGAIRTAMVWARWAERGNAQILQSVTSKLEDSRLPRQLAIHADSVNLPISISDGTGSDANLRLYYTRTARLQNELTWKETLPRFVEMAAPGSGFTGSLQIQNRRFPEILKTLNRWSLAQLDLHLAYARKAALPALVESLETIRQKTATAPKGSAVFSMGWGAGFLNKASLLDTTDTNFRSVLRAYPFYARAIQSGLPFPKTRRVIHLGENPAALPGWVELAVDLHAAEESAAEESHDTLDSEAPVLPVPPIEQSTNV